MVYSSEAVQDFSGSDLEELLLRSRSANSRDHLTGVLVHREGRFLQLIEGPDDAVRARMRVIEGDPRHDRVRVLLEEEVAERRFPEWTMGYDDDAAADLSTPGYRRTFDDIDADRSTSGTLPALRALLGWYRDRHDA